MTDSLSSLSPAQLRKAAAIKEKIEALQAELGKLVGGSASTRAGRPAGKKRRMSRAARARIAAAQKARWAKYNAAKAAKAK